MKLRVNPTECVRYFSKFSSCNLCEKVCPEKAIKTEESSLMIKQDNCVECGGCLGVCPTEALSLESFDTTGFFFDFLESNENVISCRTNVPCIAALSTEHLISIALLKELVIDIGYCFQCPVKVPLFQEIENKISEANYVLSAISDRQIEAKHIRAEKKESEKKSSRRDFLNRFTLKGALKSKKEFDEALNAGEFSKIEIKNEDIKNLRQKKIPDKRKILFVALKKTAKPDVYKFLQNKHLSFISSKNIDDSCDNCSICYRICPTGALGSDKKQSRIFFEGHLCIKCSLCHDVCDKDSINITEHFDTKELFEPSVKVLKEFNVVKCDECGNYFTYTGGERICQRCKIEEDEAMNLWGIET
ncbi:4Fe-4S dicluster domain-containing protein [Nitrosophilus alvini]|uniref:4Fe-4S dicluster domain-containing protein n=1 Tax=Nitrosophilus alvini TaxID=2714855 RepID=UPI00190C30FF|nr:4Fe-4S dicluster domain-containing protein [Nitrosophilus alvini]